MPHKRNPISSENITGCSRVLRGYMLTAYENVPLWHERDISHSSAERIILPDATILLDYMLHRFASVLENLVVFEDNMKTNIDKTFGLVFSQQVLLKLINKGVSREQAYDAVQPLAMKAWENRTHLKPLILKDPFITTHLTNREIENAFDLTHHTQYVDTIFDRAGL
jgi:adenylosuccinate lyase